MSNENTVKTVNWKPGDRVRFVDKAVQWPGLKLGEIYTVEELVMPAHVRLKELSDAGDRALPQTNWFKLDQ